MMEKLVIMALANLVKIPKFVLPVCTSFTRTYIEGQLCYELEVNKFFNEPRTEQKLRRGLTLILDYNEDRNLVRMRGMEKKIQKNLVDNIVSFEESQEALIYIKTISKKIRPRKLLKFL